MVNGNIYFLKQDYTYDTYTCKKVVNFGRLAYINMRLLSF